ncbi:hypothetical protein [Legionella fallonii]|uniref:Uncharacterized protein n=1 Tax=Legionella fallonii LLAP-10 TaxID=1212491 RepID=A0A098G174_9GAMM|nr:hypothetical protein [Legionella fallonii]CEG55734.1 membrane protein of unknown function [Legionella fallonii LLAP-10]
MSQDLFRYKTYFLTCLLLFSYVYMHLKLTFIYADVVLDQLVDFSARLPFGQRLLVPALVRGLHAFLPMDIPNLFFLVELIFVGLLYAAMKQLLQQEFSPRCATCLSWLFLLLLPLETAINYGLAKNYPAPYYYPYDSASLFFMTAGFLLCLRAQWLLLTCFIALATLNRESSILLVLLIPLVHWSQLKQVLKPFSFALLAYMITRGLVLFWTRNLPGGLVEWYYQASEYTYFEINLYWLLNMQHIFLFVYCLAGLPLLWFAFYDYIPAKYRPIRYLALFYFLGLLLIGNFPEARIFGEIVILLYLPVCAALKCWVNQEVIPLSKLATEREGRGGTGRQTGVYTKQEDSRTAATQPFSSAKELRQRSSERKGILYYLNRYAVLGILTLVALSRPVILSLI